jgi:hypothetical protein
MEKPGFARFDIVALLLLLSARLALAANPDTQGVSGNAVIRGKALGSEIVITTTSRLAGAVHSLTWGGMEFINSFDHGRQLQTAWNADAGIHPIAGETFNPTEAGSRDDGAGDTSTSRLLRFDARGNTLDMLTQPAFWLKPGETSGGKPARNKTALSDHLLRKHLVIGYKDLPNVIDETVTITIPPAEHNTFCVFEALTGYMPPNFSRFNTFDRATGKLAPLSDGPGEQSSPVIFSTEDGSHAMGAFSPGPLAGTPARGKETGPVYGRWKFIPEKVVKWNCVYRVRDAAGLGGDYSFRVFVAVGSLEDVRTAIGKLVEDSGKSSSK